MRHDCLRLPRSSVIRWCPFRTGWSTEFDSVSFARKHCSLNVVILNVEISSDEDLMPIYHWMAEKFTLFLHHGGMRTSLSFRHCVKNSMVKNSLSWTLRKGLDFIDSIGRFDHRIGDYIRFGGRIDRRFERWIAVESTVESTVKSYVIIESTADSTVFRRFNAVRIPRNVNLLRFAHLTYF
jgi:hypothetical protein